MDTQSKNRVNFYLDKSIRSTSQNSMSFRLHALNEYGNDCMRLVSVMSNKNTFVIA